MSRRHGLTGLDSGPSIQRTLPGDRRRGYPTHPPRRLQPPPMAAAATAKPLPFLITTTSRSSLRHLPTSLPTPISSPVALVPGRRPPRSYGRGHSSRRRNPQGSAPRTPTPPRAAASHSASALVGGTRHNEIGALVRP